MTTKSEIEVLKQNLRNIPDFPKKGIQFKDITTVLRQPALFALAINELAALFDREGITQVVAIESRGFITGGALAYKLGAGLIPVRKAGKLPADVYSVTYDLEYGKDTLEIHRDALSPHDVVLLHDDLLATGGTALAVIDLLKHFHVQRILTGFVFELDFLGGRQRLSPLVSVASLIHL